MRSYWVIIYLPSSDVSGTIYWAGYSKAAKDHVWSREKKDAIKFVEESDAVRAGVGTAKPSGPMEVLCG